MSPTSFFTQLIMIGIAVVIGVLYINPTISNIKQTQDSTEVYKREITKVNSVNQMLAAHVSTIDSVPLNAKQALQKYAPDNIDEFVVMKDLQSILLAAGLEPTSLTYDENSSGQANNNPEADGLTVEQEPFIRHPFSVSFESSYEVLKNFLTILEKSDYLLEVSNLSLTPSGSGLVAVDATLVAYTRKLPTVEGPNFNGDDEYIY